MIQLRSGFSIDKGSIPIGFWSGVRKYFMWERWWMVDLLENSR
jgi:hypothetical protein